jgi:hypothetical protein
MAALRCDHGLHPVPGSSSSCFLSARQIDCAYNDLWGLTGVVTDPSSAVVPGSRNERMLRLRKALYRREPHEKRSD